MYVLFQDLEKSNLNVSKIIVLVDRQQGGMQRLSERGLKITSLFNITEVNFKSNLYFIFIDSCYDIF